MDEIKADRYEKMKYNYVGKSGLKLPQISLGLWQNFGVLDDFSSMRDIILTAFSNGITHFDLANNYGPEPGRAEINFGKIMKSDLKSHRDELIISTKAGYEMWDGPYGGRGGTRKYLLSSLDASLSRMGLDYVDLFYHHCMTPDSPLSETASALSDAAKWGKAFYVGISNYDGETMNEMNAELKKRDAPFIINQNRYSIFDRTIEENGLKRAANDAGLGIIAFSPLAQGLLSDKYADGIPSGTRFFENPALWKKVGYDQKKQRQVKELSCFAHEINMTLSQLAIKWILKDGEVTSVLIGAHSKKQLLENIDAINKPDLTPDEIEKIEDILK